MPAPRPPSRSARVLARAPPALPLLLLAPFGPLLAPRPLTGPSPPPYGRAVVSRLLSGGAGLTTTAQAIALVVTGAATALGVSAGP
ncbi:hypothetical protein ABZY81_16110 [Streptomyces sp. NPDC006514]|uniref:hypothetical protein n=1 Tax=Streptomyces sp. NPDC006514 TaxID=3154308 RepID=UPI0033BD9F1E